MQTLAPVTMYPANSSLGDLPDAVVPQHGSDQLAADPFGPLATAPSGPAALIKSLVARYGQMSGAASAAASGRGRGRIAGVVTSTSGQPLAGICVEAAAANGSAAFALATTGKNGSYRTSSLPAGRYLLVIFPECGNQGNWLVQIYKGIYNPEKNPTLVRIRAGQTTGKVNVVMKQGGEISGTVTGPKGKKLSSVCVDPLSNSPDLLFFTGISHDGTYHIRSVPPGSYQIGFAPCGTADYAPTLWPGTQNYATAPFIKIRGSRHVGNINQVMQLGGIIKGTVTSATTPAAPLAGICVLVSENNGLFENGSAATSATGSYEVKGLATGSYSVQFQTGCDNNGNYVGISYPANVAVTAGSTSSGIDGSLPVGATISGTVTSASSGQPLAGVCVEIEGSRERCGWRGDHRPGRDVLGQPAARRYLPGVLQRRLRRHGKLRAAGVRQHQRARAAEHRRHGRRPGRHRHQRGDAAGTGDRRQGYWRLREAAQRNLRLCGDGQRRAVRPVADGQRPVPAAGSRPRSL